MSKCSKCQNDFTPLIKNNGLPYKTCDICRCTSNKYKDTHKEYRERECCLLVLSLVSSTLSCIRQPRLRLRVLGICGFVLVCTQAFMGFLGL